MSEDIRHDPATGHVIADELIADQVRRFGFQLTNAEAAARIEEGGEPTDDQGEA